MEKTTLIGNIGFDAETKTFNDKEYFVITIPHQRRKEDATTWYTCFYRKTPNNSVLMQYLKKGCKVYVEGNLSARAYISKKDSEPKVDLTVWVNNLEILVFPKTEDKREEERPQQTSARANSYPSFADNSIEPDFPF